MSTFQVHSKNHHAFGFIGSKIEFSMNMTPVMIHMMLIVTTDRISAVNIDFEGSLGLKIDAFLRCFINKKKKLKE